MRATEFVAEDKIGKMGKRLNQATVGLNKFRDAQFADRVYELNRIMMAVASTDGTFVPELDGESWAGRNNIAAPYTPEEQDMLKMAYEEQFQLAAGEDREKASSMFVPRQQFIGGGSP